MTHSTDKPTFKIGTLNLKNERKPILRISTEGKNRCFLLENLSLIEEYTKEIISKSVLKYFELSEFSRKEIKPNYPFVNTIIQNALLK